MLVDRTLAFWALIVIANVWMANGKTLPAVAFTLLALYARWSKK